METIPRSVEILLVEDNPGDARLILEAFKDSEITTNINTVTDGEQALHYLQKKNSFANSIRPNIIFLDLNLPKVNGLEVLETIKNDVSLKTIPVVILTTSSSDEHIVKSYNLNANCYITKPVDFDKFLDAVKTIEGFWFNVARLPNQ